MELSDAKIYVASLSDYNEGKLAGKWLDLDDYSSGSDVMDAIQGVLDELNEKDGGSREEYAIHDYEGFPKRFYSEYMGESEFDEIYELFSAAEGAGVPVDVLESYINEGHDLDSAEDSFRGSYKDKEDFAYREVEELGLHGFSSPENYIYITNTDRRILAGEESDNYVDNMRDSELISEADMEDEQTELEDKISELESEEGNEDKIEELQDKLDDLPNQAKEKVRSDKYDEIYDALDDPYKYFVQEQGLYSDEDFYKASFISIDYGKIADDLEQDYTIIEGDDGDVYVFSNYARGGKVGKKCAWSSYADDAAIITGGSYFVSKMKNGGSLERGGISGRLHTTYKDPIQYLKAMGAKVYSDINYATEDGVDYYIGEKDKKAIVVAFIHDEDNYMINKDDAREMAQTARTKGIESVELYTNYGIELHSKLEKPKDIGFDKIYKVSVEE